jgi:hypothetical protein
MKCTGINNDWKYQIEDDKFTLYINPAVNKNYNFYEACMYRAKEIYSSTRNPVLGLSGGLDSQMVLNCFYSQGLKIDCVFRHFDGYNDIELNNIKILEKKYGFKTRIISIDPIAVKEKILIEYQRTGIPPNQLLYRNFVSELSIDIDLIQGLEGPDVIKFKEKIYYLESYNSFEFARRRAVDMIDRTGKFISFEKTSNMLLSILNEEVYDTFISQYDYFYDQEYIKLMEKKLVFFWDLFVKTFIYHRYWKNELIYFPKFQGVENIDYIVFGPKHDYKSNMILIEISQLKNLLNSNGTDYKKFYECIKR